MQLWDGPDNASSPRMENILNEPFRHTQPGSDQDGGQTKVQELLKSTQDHNKNYYSNYTNVYAPIIVDSDSEPEEHMEHCAEESTDHKTAADIISELYAKTTQTSHSRFNINRGNVWDGAVRGFKRASFDPSNEILVRFTDDEGQAEDGLDNGGPKREFLTLLMNCLRTRRIFDGPEDRKFITLDSKAAKDDEYFLAGKMIATSIVHGGPGPRFLAETFYQFLTGTTTDIDPKLKISLMTP
ncbi:G2/M phase-specific E3 ubiquitin-protein ligase-like [Odontesthes bonariensis]|uniref:G2/M phase-specific E3 ubiquitin-protein ligase-like n=1 Tax=Odontesthes bonariensis TaxID=219752 RepID=UPI003F58DA5A